jgi:hypothetical protein
LRLVAAAALLAATLGVAVALPPFVNATGSGVVSLADPAEPYEGAGADENRQADLEWLAQSLDAYETTWSFYPKTESIQPICSRLADTTCVLWTIAGDMLASDGETPYFYSSNGRRFTLYALLEGPTDADACGGTTPPGWDPGHTLCRKGGAR